MTRFLKISLTVIILLSLFHTYFSLIENNESLWMFAVLYLIGVLIYYLSRIIQQRVSFLQKRPMLQLLLLYLGGVIIGIMMTFISKGVSITSFLIALKINVAAFPLFLGVVIYWHQEARSLNKNLNRFQKKLSDTGEH
ncbi:hypothetical protein I6N95_08655 [Vagococcus sp. BWB3-3]|uniref:Uncharacterized protein n=1 Tax=Vagococcus allomyrinae TaxID=2794353 RepID=A0A940P7D0_9ENTE|nr:hypothetical protein [Vagococcus allomyrinae]MBP1041071.1 hypothetical protein [Vagococcus allomyrinae]